MLVTTSVVSLNFPRQSLYSRNVRWTFFRAFSSLRSFSILFFIWGALLGPGNYSIHPIALPLVCASHLHSMEHHAIYNIAFLTPPHRAI